MILLLVAPFLLHVQAQDLFLPIASPVAASLESAQDRGSQPHIVVLLADNVGWANVGFHRPPSADPREFQTHNIDRLAGSGIELDRHYTYKFCSPSRSSFLTGRLPVHVNIYNDDPARVGQGVPTNMTMISAKLKSVGYATHFIGKWHVGMASQSQNIPKARGFDSSLGYFHSTNNYYDSRRAEGCNNEPAVDLWDTDKPAAGLNGTAYEEILFGRRAVDIILQHKPGTPLFLYYAFHTSCVGWDAKGTAGGEPDSLQPEAEYYARFSFIDDPDRRANHAMLALMDDVVGKIVKALEDQKMWDNTLLLWSSDNGGAVHLGGGANSWPLRGGYYNNWEGGVRVAALLAGGALPRSVQGTKLQGFIHEADWFATFCHLAGVDPTDARAATSQPELPPIDSLNMWPLITGANTTSPRVEWSLTPFGEEFGPRARHGGDAAYMAEGRFKLLVGVVRQAGWCGQNHPNKTEPWDSFNTTLSCTVPELNKVGCLFDVLADPSEQHDLALEMPQKANSILHKMQVAELKWFNPNRGEPDARACEVAKRTGFWQPFLP